MRSVITGTGMYIPEASVDNNALAKLMDTSDEWIQVRTGIVKRQYAAPDQATSDLAVPACARALDNAGLKPEDIDYVIFATMTPDYFFPGSAPFLQRKLGLEQVPCLDIRQQCAGFIYALQLADALIRSGQYRRVLVIGAEVHASLVPWSEHSWSVALGHDHDPVSKEDYARNTETRDRVVLFGDGAGAVVVEAREDGDRGVVDCLLHTNGDEAERLWTKAAGSAFRPYIRPEMITSGDVTPIVEGRKVYALAVTFMPQVTLEILERNGLTTDDLDLVIFHQANLRINEGVQKRLGLPDEKVFNNIQDYGNTTAGTIPIAYHEALEQGRVKPGDLVAFVGLGSGLNWGAVLYRC
ncbi:MAG: ketoacyl-ACP synthase III [Acidobacteria bacterium]|jgi:3-oxoacyl-[acyl-carrier-protein] synthase-3|nr:ketoacyl-ACP synthase III [Acidobacteriota bacterium]